MATAERMDVVVVGGGIAGSALAAALAGDGYQVLLLERQTVYRDKVRGEVINCWGVVELLELGLEECLLKAGGTYVDRFVGYDETVDPEVAQANAIPLDQMIPGIRGVLDVGHPEACEALATAAAEAGPRSCAESGTSPSRAAQIPSSATSTTTSSTTYRAG